VFILPLTSYRNSLAYPLVFPDLSVRVLFLLCLQITFCLVNTSLLRGLIFPDVIRFFSGGANEIPIADVIMRQSLKQLFAV